MPGNGKIFISHAHEDNDRCLPLLTTLDSWGADYWFDKQRMDAGQSLSQRIQQAIAERDLFIRICTPAAQASYWVDLETGAFRGLQAEEYKRGLREKRVLINLILDAGYRREPFDQTTVFIDAAGQPQGTWLAELRRAIGAGTPAEVRAPHLTAPSQPATRVVDALHRGNHATITEAIQAAGPGDRILVRRGLYREGLVIDKPLELVGDGNLGDVVIEATGSTVVIFQTTYGRLSNLTLRQMGGGDGCGVDITQGRLELEGCDITSQTLSNVCIRGGANPVIRSNRIHDGQQCGILVLDHGQGTVEDNDVYGNTLAGVDISAGGNPTVRRNRIHDGKGNGVSVYNHGEGIFEDNDIYSNARAAIEITSYSNPTIRRNRITNNTYQGVWIHDGGGGIIADNLIHDEKQCGIFISDRGSATIEGNDIHDNALAGIDICADADPTIRNNRIHNGKVCGLLVRDRGRGTVEDNDIYDNAYAGIEVRARGNPTIRRNRIHDGKGDGVDFWDHGQGSVEDNDIHSNARVGIEIRAGGSATIRRNRIKNNAFQGVWVHDGGGGTIEDNDLRENAGGGLLLQGRVSSLKVRHARNQE